MAGGAETPNIAALPAIVLIGAGSGRRSAREAIDLSNDGGVTLGRLFTLRAMPIAAGVVRDLGICERAVFVAADREGLPRTERFCDDCGARSAGFSHDQRLPQAAFEGARRAVPAGSEAVRDGRAGQTRPCCAGWHEDQGERLET